MKKLPFAIAVVVCVSGVAHAQSNVTLHGLVDLGIEVVNKGNGSVVRIQSGQWFGSCFGLHADEDLGGGYFVNAVRESGITADVGGLTSFGTNTSSATTTFWDRYIFIGLDRSIGRLRLGKQYSLTDNIKGAVEPFNSGMARDTSPLCSLNPSRTDNAIVYYTSSLAELQVDMMYSTGRELIQTATKSKRAGPETSVITTFVREPLYIGAAYDELYGRAGSTANSQDGQKARSWIFGSTYDLKFLKLRGWVNVHKAGAVATASDLIVSRDFLNYAIGAAVPINSRTKIYTSFAVRNDKTAPDRDPKKWGIGVSHEMSKRTTLYASFDQTKNADRFMPTGAADCPSITQGSRAAS